MKYIQNFDQIFILCDTPLFEILGAISDRWL